MATKLSLAEQIQRLYKRAIGTEESAKDAIDRREIYPLIHQVTNELVGAVMQEAQKVGGISVPSSIIATYSANAVNIENGRYYANIPVYPLMLPRNMGVYSVVPQSGNPLVDGSPYIPITQEDWDLLSVSDLNDSGMLEGQTAFYVEGRKAFFTKQPTNVVKMKLLISDPALIGDNDPYPITPEIEVTLINRVLEILKGNTAGQIKLNPQDI